MAVRLHQGAGVPVNSLVFIETRAGEPTPGSIGLIAMARQLAPSVSAIVGGPEAEAIAGRLGAYGVTTTWACPDARLDGDRTQPFVDAVAHVVRAQGDDCIVLFENSALTADIAAGLAARLEAGVNWDLQDVTVRDGELVGRRLALNDSMAVEVGWTTATRVAVFRLGMFEPAEDALPNSVSLFQPDFSAPGESVVVAERLAAAEAGAQLRNAQVVVAAGRGLKDQASLSLIEDLADALGGALGVSLPLVDRGWCSPAFQIGQTGAIVRPRLYVACGISGALQHRVGMDRSTVIVAINTDPEAPIFSLCDAGVIGDLHTVVPELTRLVRAGKPS